MPLVAHNDLPAFKRLQDRGQNVLSAERAKHQDIRELHIGLLNIMPDAALVATEHQFVRLIGASNQIAQFYIYPFTIPEMERSSKAKDHIDKYYFNFSDLCDQGLDALIITGANPANPVLEDENFWGPLIKIIDWASDNVASMLCSCLATHALVKSKYDINRQRLPRKKWGVYKHKITDPKHPLTWEINTNFDAPHSRYNDISRTQMEKVGIKVLAESDSAGVHLAVSPDQFRVVYFQGHPEYNAVSLLKEYKREVLRFIENIRETEPQLPRNYFSTEAEKIISQYMSSVKLLKASGNEIPAFPEAELESLVHNTWGDTGKAIVNNWLGLVYQLTNLDRHLQFMDGIDPENPLGLK